jgi:hypothetical protein
MIDMLLTCHDHPILVILVIYALRTVDTGGKSILLFLFIFLDTDPHLASVRVISISFPFRDMSCVCVWELVYVCACVHKFGVATNHGKF